MNSSKAMRYLCPLNTGLDLRPEVQSDTGDPRDADVQSNTGEAHCPSAGTNGTCVAQLTDSDGTHENAPVSVDDPKIDTDACGETKNEHEPNVTL